MRRRLLSAAFAAAACCAALMLPAQPAAAAQLLTNGGFESGTAGWSGIGISASGCNTRSGSGALTMTSGNEQTSLASQRIETAAQGSYSLSGYARLSSGGPMTLEGSLTWRNSQELNIQEQRVSLTLSASYQSFAIPAGGVPAEAVALSVRLRVPGSGVACVDDVVLEGPQAATATPAPTLTPTLAATETPTRTPVPPTATRTARPATSTRIPSSTRAPASTKVPTATASSGSGARSATAPEAPREAIVNGGFEGGLAPWHKFGGELALVSAPVHEGVAAGSLSSSTASTKWAYQVVLVQGGGTYQFDGYVLPAGGVAEAYLRISWYASSNGSGSALSNTDSTERVAAGGADFTYLTTEAVEAPTEARSARVRVMLAPAGVGAGALYMDDLAFGPSDAAPRPNAEELATAEDIGAPAGEEDSGDEPAKHAASSGSPSATGTSAAAPRVAGKVATTSPEAVARQDLVSTANGGSGRSPLVYLLLGAGLATGATAATALAVRRFFPEKR